MDFFDTIISILALTLLEIILGIDNLVFLTILTEKLPEKQRRRASRLGLTFAWVTRLLLLASAVWIVKLTKPFLVIGGVGFSVRDLFLFAGGAFLIIKATQEIHDEIEPEDSLTPKLKAKAIFHRVVIQIALMDIIFSFDSVLTAIGLTTNFLIMALAITIAIFVMIYASTPISRFISKHPTIKMLALSFLILIGTMLIADGFGFHVPRGYLYSAMAFSLLVEILNLVKRTRRNKIKK